MKYQVLIFDLDDTLFDTCGQLVDRASRESCLQMIELGLQADVDSCMQKRQELFKENPRKNIYDQIVQSFGEPHVDVMTFGCTKSYITAT